MKLADDLIKSIETEPQRWMQGEHCFCRDDGVQIWTKISLDGLYRPQLIPFSFLTKSKVRRAIKHWRDTVSLDDVLKSPMKR